MNQDNEEKWKDIEGYEGLYAVSDKGRVKSLKSGRVLKPGVTRHDYEYVILSKNRKQKFYTVHRLVAQAFLENANNLPQVNHISEDKRDNNLNNLAWVTASQNIMHSAHQYSCKIIQLTLDGEFIKEWGSAQEIERELGFSGSYIITCCKGKSQKAYNYKWSYADPSQQHKYNRPIVVTTTEDDFIAQFKNVSEASRCLGIISQCIRNVLKGRCNTTHGFKFRYLDELSQEIKSED